MRNSLSLFCGLLLLCACAPSYYQPSQVQYGSFPVGKNSAPADTSVSSLIRQYSEKVDQTMNDVIGKADEEIEKKAELNELGYFMTDAYLQQAGIVYQQPVDIAVMNFGGIRKNSIGPGNISMGTIYELMPFDNIVVLIKLTGGQTLELLSHLGNKAGTAVSGTTYTMRNKKAENVQIGGVPFDAGKQYTIAVSDYMANGGDDCKMLIGIPQINKGYLQRDAIIDYVKSITAKGQTIKAPKEPRVNIER